MPTALGNGLPVDLGDGLTLSESADGGEGSGGPASPCLVRFLKRLAALKSLGASRVVGFSKGRHVIDLVPQPLTQTSATSSIQWARVKFRNAEVRMEEYQ